MPEEKKEAYVAAAKIVAEVAKEFGALEIFENWELEVPSGQHTDYRQAVKALPGEKIVFSWVVWPDRETGAVAHKGMWADPRMEGIGEMPLDGKRMIMGGFEPILAYPQSVKLWTWDSIQRQLMAVRRRMWSDPNGRYANSSGQVHDDSPYNDVETSNELLSSFTDNATRTVEQRQDSRSKSAVEAEGNLGDSVPASAISAITATRAVQPCH